MPKRYVVRKIVAKKRKWMRAQTFLRKNFPSIATASWASYTNTIVSNASRTGTSGSALSVSATRVKVKNVRVEFNGFDTNAGESLLASIVYVPAGRNIGTEVVQGIDVLGSNEYSFACPDYVMAQKHLSFNDYDDSRVVLFSSLSRWLGPGDSIQILVTHINSALSQASAAGYLSFVCSYVVCDN